jgi:nitrate reductase NapE component
MSKKREGRTLSDERDEKVARDTAKLNQELKQKLVFVASLWPIAIVVFLGIFRNMSPERKASFVENLVFGFIGLGLVIARAAGRR